MTGLSSRQANLLIHEVLLVAKEKAILAPAALDSGAHLKLFQREDGVSFLRAQIAQAKARGALAMSCTTDQLAERYRQDQGEQGFISALNTMTAGKIVPLPRCAGSQRQERDHSSLRRCRRAFGDDEARVRTAIESLDFKLS